MKRVLTPLRHSAQELGREFPRRYLTVLLPHLGACLLTILVLRIWIAAGFLSSPFLAGWAAVALQTILVWLAHQYSLFLLSYGDRSPRWPVRPLFRLLAPQAAFLGILLAMGIATTVLWPLVANRTELMAGTGLALAGALGWALPGPTVVRLAVSLVAAATGGWILLGASSEAWLAAAGCALSGGFLLLGFALCRDWLAAPVLLAAGVPAHQALERSTLLLHQSLWCRWSSTGFLVLILAIHEAGGAIAAWFHGSGLLAFLIRAALQDLPLAFTLILISRFFRAAFSNTGAEPT